MKVNFDFNLVDSSDDKEVKQPKIVDGKPIIVDGKPVYEAVNAIPLLAQCIVHPNFVKSDYIKHTELRERIIKEKEFDIDKADFDLIKKSIECQTNSLSPLAKGIILLKFREFDINNSLPIPPESETKAKEAKEKK